MTRKSNSLGQKKITLNFHYKICFCKPFPIYANNTDFLHTFNEAH